MAIKDQCLQCTHFNNGTCAINSTIPNYNHTSCESYRKNVINLEKSTQSQTSIDTLAPVEPQQVQQEKQRMFSNPFSFVGRIRRTEYCLSFIIMYVYAILVGLFVGAANGGEGIVFPFLIPAYWFIWAQGAKRCHDRDNSGWYQLIPFYGLWMCFGDGDAYENSYGPDPKGRDMQS